MNVLEAEGLTYSYPGGGVPALNDMTLRIADGELVVIVGLSGSGKSTLLRAACGLVPHFYGGEVSGSLRVNGLDVRDHGPSALADSVGTLTQDPETQVVMNSVRAELAFGLENRGYGAAQTARAVEEVALALGIDTLLARRTAELSGGELQRVALGAALAGRPRLLVLDEPTSQLDPVAGAELLGLLRRLNEEWGTAVMLAEQRLERALPGADRVIVTEAGRIACDAAPREFLAWAAEHAPTLLTPAATLFAKAGIAPAPTDVKGARRTLRAAGLLPAEPSTPRPRARPRARRAARASSADPVLRWQSVWHEWPGGAAALRDVSLSLRAGERVALMGANGAGKSTLLRQAAGLLEPTRGSVRSTGRVALLLQHPGDYLIHERVADEAGTAELAEQGLGALAERHPRDLSGGERQRLALAVVLAAGDAPPAVLALDEPTRGMDRERRDALADELRGLAGGGVAVVVATHDPEFAAACADRVVLLGDGRLLADAGAGEILAGGLYFATETARVLGGAGGALLPDEGAALLCARPSARVPSLDSGAALGAAS